MVGREDGFTYVGLLILLAVMAVVAEGSLQMGAILQRKEAEESLLDIGAQYRAALKSYAQAMPGAPHSLQDLVRDPRFPNPRRHIRNVYPDPLTGSLTWGLVLTPDGNGIAGVYSLAPGHPIKTANFSEADRFFADKKSYADWVFMPAQAPALPTGVAVPSK